MAPGMEPPEVQSIKSMLHIVRILAIIFGILLLIGGIAYAAFLGWAASTCGALGGGAYCGVGLGSLLLPAIFIIIFGVVDFIIYTQMREIEALVDQRQYERAKSKTLIWMVLGFILGGIILGVILLIAYIKFDPVISWARSGGGTMPPQAGTAMPSAAPAGDTKFCPACGGPNPRAATFCAKCGKPLPPG